MKTIDVDIGFDEKLTCVAMPSIGVDSDGRGFSSCDFCAATDNDNTVLCADLPDCEDIVWVSKNKMHEYVAYKLTGDNDDRRRTGG